MSVEERLPAPAGLLLDRSKKITFRFQDKQYEAWQGDSIASALAASGQWILSRSFKYHRPRGILSMAGQDANALVQLPSDPNTLADITPVRDQLAVAAQNFKGSLEHDKHAWIGRFSRFMPAGFYYKAFFRPKGVWEKIWAPIIRSRAGLGVVDTDYSSGYFDKQYAFTDVAVVGAGPAGLSAALEAANGGASVLLVDENRLLGGSLTYARLAGAADAAARQREELVSAVRMHANITVMCESICNGWFADNWLAVIKGNRLYKVRAKEVIICSGSMEQPAIFHNNDLPGIMLGSAAQRLIKWYAVRPGRQAVVLTGNSHGYGVALDLMDAGVQVAAVVDMRAEPAADALSSTVADRGVRIITGSAVYEAVPDASKNHVVAVEVRGISARGRCADHGERITCDVVCMSPGYTPAYQLICHAGGRVAYDDATSMFTLEGLPQHMHMAGSVTGMYVHESVCAEGRHAGHTALKSLGLSTEDIEPAPVRGLSDCVNFDWPIFVHPAGKEFVDFDEDLQIHDIVVSTLDGYEDIQLVKRYTTVGMGPSQGRHSALATARIVADATGRTVAETGVTTARPPFAPERLAHNAGRSFYPERHSAMHHRHLEAGAQMLIAGAWLRPAFYGEKGQRDQCMAREAINVRQNVGLVDVSTLGGIEVRGPDAAELLQRIYTFRFAKQVVGRCRYAVMANEQGVVIDDGVACRLHEQLYYVTATTGGVDRVYQSMLRWNAQWRLNVDIANVTSTWCGVNIAGPKSREVLTRLCTDVDLSSPAFPYMGVQEGHVAEIPARIMRVGFVGELGYEIHVPQHYGEYLWDRLMEAGIEYGIQPFGIEAQRLLRLEKGHIIIGQDTDAMSFPAEVNLDWAVAKEKPFFVGNRAIQEVNARGLTRKLAGFVIDDAGAPRPQESHLVLDGDRMTGRVTSCYFSPTLDKSIGMAFVAPEQAQPGSMVTIKSTNGRLVEAKIVKLPFYDPDNKRQEM